MIMRPQVTWLACRNILVFCTLGKYKKSFKCIYFKNSQININEKLRITVSLCSLVLIAMEGSGTAQIPCVTLERT